MLRHRALSDSGSDVDVEVEVEVEMSTTCKWCPLLSTVGVLLYLHGIALGWYMCSK
jgi:hypothetical protein